MKHVFALVLLCFSTTALANRESGGAGGPKTLVCHDQFTEQASTVVLTAQVTNFQLLTNVELKDAALNGVTLHFDSLALRPFSETGVQVLKGNVHATPASATVPPGASFVPDFSVILTLGTDWLNTPAYSVGQLQRYCDQCGGGIPTFAPNVYCTVQ